MPKYDPTKTDFVEAEHDTGVTVRGSSEEGHKVQESRSGALGQTFGTSDDRQAEALLVQCFESLKLDEATDEYPVNDQRTFMLSVIRDIAPRDAIERMLAVQMASTHVAMIRQGGRMAFADQLSQFDSHERAFNKLARTFTAQMEALRKHRNGGRQTVTVQHVNVSDGGQAIVGNVKARGASRR